MKKTKWYCYICGQEIGKEFYLWSLNERIDRVFLCCSKEKCKEQLGKEALILKVKRI